MTIDSGKPKTESRRNCGACIAAASTLLLICVAEGSAATVRLRGSAKTNSPIVTLGDVADVADVDLHRVARLESITLAPAPAAGRPLRLNFATIRSRLLAQGVNLANVEFSGKSIVTVASCTGNTGAPPRLLARPVSRHVKQAEQLVDQAVKQYLARQAPELGAVKLSLHIERNDVPLILAGADSGYEVRGGGPHWNMPQRLAVRFLDREKRLHEVSVGCVVKQRPYAVMVKHTVPAGHVLRPDDLVLSPVETAAGALTRPEDVIGKETKRPISQGQQIQSRDVRSIPLVRAGDFVTVHSRRPGISVRRQMKSRNDGTQGDTITLVSLDGRKKLLATVTGYHEAEVIGSSGPPKADLRDATGTIRFRPTR